MRIQLSAAAALALVVGLIGAGCDDSPYAPRGSAPDGTPRYGSALEGGSGGVTVPATGGSEDGGEFRGTITITGAAFDEQLGPLLLGRIRGTLFTKSSDEDGSPTESGSLNFEDVEYSYQDNVRGDEDCIELVISSEPQFDAETKQTIVFDPARLATERLPGPANLIADLICAVDEAIQQGWSPSQPPQ